MANTTIALSDSIVAKQNFNPSPKKAALWAMIPGGGQVYNRKYWKLPIVYGAIGGGGFFIGYNAVRLKNYNKAIYNKLRGLSVADPNLDALSVSQLTSSRNNFRTNLEVATIVTTLLWGLSFVDAIVDAHMHSFDIGDNLSMKLSPKILTVHNNYYPSIRLTLQL
jgi:hypothetical protein